MKSPFYFIVKPVDGERYNNKTDISGKEIITNTSEENHLASNRKAIVVSTPLNYTGDIEPGDILLVHHNVFKFYNDIKGRQKSGRSYFMNNLFFVDSEQFFLYYKNNKWNTHSKYCFVEPIPPTESFIFKPLTEEPLMGKIKYVSDKLLSQGVKENDFVSFHPDSEYEFEIDGNKLYRMFEQHITLVM
jgi:hypothetical protein